MVSEGGWVGLNKWEGCRRKVSGEERRERELPADISHGGNAAFRCFYQSQTSK